MIQANVTLDYVKETMPKAYEVLTNNIEKFKSSFKIKDNTERFDIIKEIVKDVQSSISEYVEASWGIAWVVIHEGPYRLGLEGLGSSIIPVKDKEKFNSSDWYSTPCLSFGKHVKMFANRHDEFYVESL